MIISFIRTIILYISVLVGVRLMGKKEIGELQPAELIITIMISDLASVPMQNIGVPLLNGIIPIFTLVILEIFLSKISFNNKKIQTFFSGKPSIIMRNGQIDYQELERLRYNVDDFLGELRKKDIFNINDVDIAIIETDGSLSVIPVPEKKPLTPSDMNIKPQKEELPYTFINDGKLIPENLKRCNISNKTFKKMLKNNGIKKIEDVYLATYTKDNGLVVKKK